MTERLFPVRRTLRWSPTVWSLTGVVAVVVVCWILGNPRSSGPDEASHMVAASALVRGDRSGIADPANPGFELFELPGMVGAPDPGCWALTYDVPVSCAETAPLTTDERLTATTSQNYPPWAFLLPGLASYAPTAGGYAYLARALNALLPVVLLGASLMRLSRRRVALAAGLLALTPIAWFSFGIVNPSALAIAGGFALWTALLHRDDRGDQTLRFDALAVAGWAAVLLARRDGPVWATLIVLACCWLLRRRPADLWRDLGPRARWIAVGVAVLPPLTPLVNGERGFNLALSFVPLGLVAVDLLARWGERMPTPQARRALVGYSAAGVALAAALATTARPGGFRADTVRLVVANTGDHLRQLVGILGWLSTPVPLPAVFLFWAVVGGLATVAYLESRRVAVIGLAVLGATVVMAWLLELGQGANDGQYWQGRYSMPFAIGLPIVLAWRATPARGDAAPDDNPGDPDPSRASRALVDDLATVVAGAAWLIANTAFVAAQQRWAVGIGGSWYPWAWNTWDAPLPPVVLVVVHAVATGVLAIELAPGARRAAAGVHR